MATSEMPSISTVGNLSTVDPAEEFHCSLFDGDQHLCDIIVVCKRVVASLSLIGCVFMIFIIWLFRKYVVFIQRLILYLTIAAMFDSIAYLIGGLTPDGSWCDFQSWMLTFFDWSVLLWVCCITFNLYMNALKMTRTDRFEWAYHAVSWGVPFFISMLPFIGNHYGPAGMWCWIVDTWQWRFGIWYCPLFMIIGILILTYSYIIVMVNRKVRTWEGMYDPDTERNKEMLKEDVKPLRAYPFVYLVTNIFPLINRIQNAVNPNAIFALVLLHALSSPLQGACNAIVYGIDKETASRLTPTQIKVALDSHRYSNKSLIREYPTGSTADTGNPDHPGQS